MTAHVLIDVLPGHKTAGISMRDLGGSFDLIAVADALDLYAEERLRPVQHHEPFAQNGVELPKDHAVVLCLIDDDLVVHLHHYGVKLSHYHARGAAHWLRTQAMTPQLQQIVVQSLAAVDQAKAQAQAAAQARGPNGESLESIARGIILPGH